MIININELKELQEDVKHPIAFKFGIGITAVGLTVILLSKI